MRRRSFLALSLATALPLASVAARTGIAAGAGVGTGDRVDYVGRYRWWIDDPAFGGFSAIEVDDDGLGFLALSDRSAIVRGRFTRDASGRIAGIEAGPITPLTLKGGKPARMDAEGLAVSADGRVFISEERTHRVAVSRNPGQELAYLPPLPGAKDMIRNKSLEALAIDRSGDVYTLPEEPRTRGSYPVYRFRKGAWTIPFTLPRNEDWAAVGADFGPDGTFYLLERGFAGIGGFRSRIRAFSFGPDGATEYPVLLETPFRSFGNLEGLSVWLDAEGYERFTMISDDNFLTIGLYTDIVEFRARTPLDPARILK